MLYYTFMVSSVMNSYLGVVIASGDTEDDAMLNKRVFLSPSHGWDDDPDAPEGQSVNLLLEPRFPRFYPFQTFFLTLNNVDSGSLAVFVGPPLVPLLNMSLLTRTK